MKYYLAKSIMNLLPYSKIILGNSAWIQSGSGSIENRISNSGSETAVYLSDTSSITNLSVRTYIVNSNFIGNSVFFGVSIGKEEPTSMAGVTVLLLNDSIAENNTFIFDKSTGAVNSNSMQSSIFSTTVTENGSYWDLNINAVAADSSCYMAQIYLRGAAALTSFPSSLSELAIGGSVFDRMVLAVGSLGVYIPTSGSAVGSENTFNDIIEIHPDYNYEITGKKIEERKRARSGREYVYKWGQYEGRKFDVSYVSNADKTKINSWWSGNDSLLFIYGITKAITSVRIQNDKIPISKLEKPYTDLWKGTIELETY